MPALPLTTRPTSDNCTGAASKRLKTTPSIPVCSAEHYTRRVKDHKAAALLHTVLSCRELAATIQAVTDHWIKQDIALAPHSHL